MIYIIFIYVVYKILFFSYLIDDLLSNYVYYCNISYESSNKFSLTTIPQYFTGYFS